MGRESNASINEDDEGAPTRARRTQWALSAEQEEACVFREDEDATMFANNEAFALAKMNYVQLIGEVEPVEDREEAVAARPKTDLQRQVDHKRSKFEGQNTNFAAQTTRNELRRWQETNRTNGPANKRLLEREALAIENSAGDDDLKAMKRAELKAKMETMGLLTEKKPKKVKEQLDPDVNYTFAGWDPRVESFPCPSGDQRLPSEGPAFLRVLDRKAAFERETANQSAASRELDRELEHGTLAKVVNVVKDRAHGRVREYFNTQVKSHEEEAIDGVVLDKAERKRRKLLAKARRKRLKENPHNLDWGSSRMKRSALGKCLNRVAACGRSAGKAAYDRRGAARRSRSSTTPRAAAARGPSSESTRAVGVAPRRCAAVARPDAAGPPAAAYASVRAATPPLAATLRAATPERFRRPRPGSPGDAPKTAPAPTSRSPTTRGAQPVFPRKRRKSRTLFSAPAGLGDGASEATDGSSLTSERPAGVPGPRGGRNKQKRKKSAASAASDAPAGTYECEKGCGFRGGFDDVAAHEATCAYDPADYTDGSTVATNESKSKLYECERGCGFRGDFEGVSRHEKTCAFERPGVAAVEADVPPPADPDPASSSNLNNPLLFECERDCGFRGSHAEVAAHEKTCAFGDDESDVGSEDSAGTVARKKAKQKAKADAAKLKKKEDLRKSGGFAGAASRRASALGRKLPSVANLKNLRITAKNFKGLNFGSLGTRGFGSLRPVMSRFQPRKTLNPSLRVFSRNVVEPGAQLRQVVDSTPVYKPLPGAAAPPPPGSRPEVAAPRRPEEEARGPRRAAAGGDADDLGADPATPPATTTPGSRRERRNRKRRAEEKDEPEGFVPPPLDGDEETKEESAARSVHFGDGDGRRASKNVATAGLAPLAAAAGDEAPPPRSRCRRFCCCCCPRRKRDGEPSTYKRSAMSEANMSFEEKLAARAERKRRRTCAYQLARCYRNVCKGSCRYPTIEDARKVQRFFEYLYSFVGIPKPVLWCLLGGINACGAAYDAVALRVAKVFFAGKLVYRAAKLCWNHEPQYDYDDLLAAVTEGRVDDLRFIFLDKYSGLQVEETTLDGRTMLFVAIERQLQHEFSLREELDRLARAERVSPGLFFMSRKQQIVELEDVEVEQRRNEAAQAAEEEEREKAEIKAARKDKVKSHATKMLIEKHKAKKKKKTKAEKLKEEGLKPPTPLDLIKKSEKLTKTAEYLVGKGADINTQQDPRRHAVRHEGTGWGVLHHAAVAGNVDKIRWVMGKGAIVDLATEEGETPLMMAALAGATRGVQILLEYNASVTKTCFKGYTALHYAGSVGALDCAALLLRAGANKRARTLGDVKSPSDLAKDKGHTDTFSLIKLYKEPAVPVREVFDAMLKSGKAGGVER
ncbi:spectrin binding protein [Aureococcus anophagefferens]|uniref:Spectrin binding protein n=1 Tax=Aureococcus anophagefferens TaxID=44056 RepID=A0ABR1FHF3_AURAN